MCRERKQVLGMYLAFPGKEKDVFVCFSCSYFPLVSWLCVFLAGGLCANVFGFSLFVWCLHTFFSKRPFFCVSVWVCELGMKSLWTASQNSEKKEGFSQRKKKPEQLKKSRKKEHLMTQAWPSSTSITTDRKSALFFLVVRHVNSFRFCKNKMCESSKMERREVKQEKKKAEHLWGSWIQVLCFYGGKFHKRENVEQSGEPKKMCWVFREWGFLFDLITSDSFVKKRGEQQ